MKHFPDEGYIKFDLDWQQTSSVITQQYLSKICKWRDTFFDLSLIGAYPNGIGYGNISMRLEGTNKFIITGSATGNKENLYEEDFSQINSYNLETNQITATGPIKPSSESLSHALLYSSDKNINAVIHVHDFLLWNSLLFKVPTTALNNAYGTPEMAKEIKRLYNETDLSQKKILVMGGHKEGVLTFGNTIDEAGKVLLDYFYNKNKF